MEALAAMLAKRVAAEIKQKPQPEPKKDTRTVAEALSSIAHHLFEVEKRYRPSYREMISSAFAKATSAIGEVRLCDLDREHVAPVWQALNGPSPGPAGAFVARLSKDAARLGFEELERFHGLLPKVQPGKLRHVCVSDEIHREALRCVRWAATNTDTKATTLRIIECSMRIPTRISEICAAEWRRVDLRARLLHLEDSKGGAGAVVLTEGACELLREQRQSLPWDATFVWPSDSATGHVLKRSVSHAWRRIRAAYCEIHQTEEAKALLDSHLHDLRGYLATQASEHGASIRHIQQALRHKDPRTTERYVHGAGRRGAARAMQLVEDVLEGRAVGLNASPIIRVRDTDRNERREAG